MKVPDTLPVRPAMGHLMFIRLMIGDFLCTLYWLMDWLCSWLHMWYVIQIALQWLAISREAWNTSCWPYGHYVWHASHAVLWSCVRHACLWLAVDSEAWDARRPYARAHSIRNALLIGLRPRAVGHMPHNPGCCCHAGLSCKWSIQSFYYVFNINSAVVSNNLMPQLKSVWTKRVVF